MAVVSQCCYLEQKLDPEMMDPAGPTWYLDPGHWDHTRLSSG